MGCHLHKVQFRQCHSLQGDINTSHTLFVWPSYCSPKSNKFSHWNHIVFMVSSESMTLIISYHRNSFWFCNNIHDLNI